MNIDWGGQNFKLLPERAMYWIEKSTLIFSDVHLGKAHDFQASGIPIPAAVHDEDFQRMNRLLRAHQPTRVLILGDFVHSHRTELADLIETFQSLRRDYEAEWVLALGNHDLRAQEKLKAWGFDAIVREVVEEGIVFSHDPDERAALAISGHVHPVVRLGGGRDRLRVPCFVIGPRRLLLPSFGDFTGGFEIKPKPAERVFVIGDNHVIDL
jgi:DNA ligase-associated metallophosphoesterase